MLFLTALLVLGQDGSAEPPQKPETQAQRLQVMGDRLAALQRYYEALALPEQGS